MLKHLNARNRACVGATCKNTRDAITTASNKASTNYAYLEKALIVRGILREFLRNDSLMEALAIKAVWIFRDEARRGATMRWAATFLHVNVDEVYKYEDIGIITMQTLLEKKIKVVDGLLLDIIKKLRRNNNNNRNNTGHSTLTKWDFKRFEVVSDTVRIPSFLFLFGQSATATSVSRFVSKVRIQ